MEKVKFKYFVNGVETELEQIDWVNSTGFTREDNNVYVDYPIDYKYTNISNSAIDEEDKESVDLSNVLNHLIKEFGLVPVEYIDVKNDGKAPIWEYRDECCDSNYESRKYLEDLHKQQEFSQSEYKGCDTAYESAVGCMNDGVKYNSHKAPLDIVINRQFPKALQLVALATAFGNKKYEETDKDFLNFKRVKGGSQTYFDAAARHNTARDFVDEDSLLPHVIHAVWNMLAALEIMAEEKEIDIEKVSKEYLEDLHK